MSIGQFSKTLAAHVIKTARQPTKDLRKTWEAARVNQLNLDPTSMTRLLGDLKQQGIISAKNYNRIAEEILAKSAQIAESLKSGDVVSLSQYLGRPKGLEALMPLTAAARGKLEVSNLGDTLNISKPEIRDTGTTFKVLDEIRNYIFKGKGYNLTKYIEKGHIVGLASRQFSEAERALDEAVSHDIEEAVLLQKLFRIVYEILRKDDIESSNVPGANLNDQLTWIIQRTAMVPSGAIGVSGAPSWARSVGMIVEFQSRAKNQQSGSKAGTDKDRFFQIFDALFKEASYSEHIRRASFGGKDNKELTVLRQKAKAIKDSTKRADFWNKKFEEYLRKELLYFVNNDEALANALIAAKGSPSFKEVAISRVVSAIKKNVRDNLKLNQYKFEIKQQIKADPALKKYRDQLNKSMAEATKLAQEAKKLESQLKKDKAAFKEKLRRSAAKLEGAHRVKMAEVMSPAKLQYLLNVKLRPTIVKNMGRPNLINITGRFASSVSVVGVSPRGNALEIFYTYMKYPYQTFEPGFKQGQYGYDPRRVIDQSIREIATNLVTTRFRTVRV